MYNFINSERPQPSPSLVADRLNKMTTCVYKKISSLNMLRLRRFSLLQDGSHGCVLGRYELGRMAIGRIDFVVWELDLELINPE